MQGYAKLFCSILQSSVWDLPPEERVVWITLLAMKDQHGVVSASVSGVAHEARLPKAAVERAMGIFLAPDPESRSPEFEGRRLEVVPGVGWRVLNHGKYRDLESLEDRRQKNAARQQRHRDRQKAKKLAAELEPGVTFVTQNNASNGIRSDQIREEGEAHRNGPTKASNPRASGMPSLEDISRATANIWEATGDRNAQWWFSRFKVFWGNVTNGLVYGRGTDRDSRAVGELEEMLVSLDADQRRALERSARAMLDTFFKDTGEAKRAGFPFSWFVGRFQGLRTKVQERAGDFGDASASEYPEEDEEPGAARGA